MPILRKQVKKGIAQSCIGGTNTYSPPDFLEADQRMQRGDPPPVFLKTIDWRAISEPATSMSERSERMARLYIGKPMPARGEEDPSATTPAPCPKHAFQAIEIYLSIAAGNGE